jgi:hypothetical protein
VRTSGPLANGFEIEKGSGLVGTLFPLSYGEGRQAVLRVDGGGPAVFEGYVRQAEGLGFSLMSEVRRPGGQWCTDPDDDVDDEPPGPFAIGCNAYAGGPDVTLALRGFLGADGQGWIHLRTYEYSADGPRLPRLADGPAAPATDVEVAPDLTPETDDPPVRVVEGSAPASDPIPAECVTGGYVAVLQVTGDLLPVLRGYSEQFAAAGFGPEVLVGDEDEPRIDAGTAGGGILSAVGVAGDPSHVLVERCND